MSRSSGRLRLCESVESRSERSGATRTGEPLGTKGAEEVVGVRGRVTRRGDVAGRTEVI